MFTKINKIFSQNNYTIIYLKPDIIVNGLSNTTFVPGLFNTFIKGESGFMASRPGKVSTSFLLLITADANVLKDIYKELVSCPVARPGRLKLI